ncbi:MAG: hypothetical protein QF486_00870 [Candidatus Woesearchaeota archaeon]|jgi:hypothetical protein|nr:hypothetical protein [Candidatus Woesearchaeota archaeon]MDP7198151.1 hypothetical protein [Candidatus Woesearchaeota archaeon]MDP7466986.1 hypothetical protein [Candidatus Woesearchaeota archaeon]MDP7646656.1 hypothetical protein [Candidatus Woesearchaeota archaeon]
MSTWSTKNYRVESADTSVHFQECISNAYARNVEYFEKDIPFFSIVVEEPPVTAENANSWLIGTPGYGSSPLTVKGPRFLEKTRKYILKDFENLVTHEMCHRFQLAHFDFTTPCWLYEGMAGHVGEQTPADRYWWVLERGINELAELHRPAQFYALGDYIGAFSIAYVLHTLSDKKTIMKFMSQSTRADDFEESSKTFENVFSFSIDSLCERWLSYLESSRPERSKT